MFKSAVLSTATFGLAAMAVAAAAQPTVSEVTVRPPPRPGVEVRSKVVSFRDLDISAMEGAESLLGRIRQASEEVCTPAPTTVRNLKDLQDYERCKSDAIDGAVAQVNSPTLSTLYARVH